MKVEFLVCETYNEKCYQFRELLPQALSSVRLSVKKKDHTVNK
jgi:hypothetical protein